MAAVVYHSVIYSFVGDINHQIMTNFEIVIFNTQVKTLSHSLSGFKRSDTVGTSISCGSEYDMVLNPTLDVLLSITCGGWNPRG